ncbi:MAG: bifunctional methionine sulfoxide reductase B/A protein [Bacteroidales bacterium]
MEIILFIFALILTSCGGSIAQSNSATMNMLTDQERYVIEVKGTEAPFSGIYNDLDANGTYICKRCDAPLYNSTDKFNSGCGWPSFDDEIEGSITRSVDEDGSRTEITCTACGAHLGHVFEGEGFTDKNVRHCVNSVSLNFIPEVEFEEAIFAGGCFWGVEHLLQQQEGVVSVESGYTGGWSINPTYQEILTHTSGHAEAVKVVYDPTKLDYETLAKLFFEIHDPTQLNRQGPDIGTQYRSQIFYKSDEQRGIAERLIETLKGKGLNVVTKVTEASKFYPAEEYHQDYYKNKGSQPYCHAYVKRF